MYPNTLFTIPLINAPVNLYGIMMAIGLVACLVVYYLLTNHKGTDKDVQDFVFFTALCAIAGGFVCAKFFQAVFNWIETGRFDFANAGITVMSGVLGGAAIFLIVYFGIGKLYFKGKKKNIHVRQFNDTLLAAPCCILIAHAFGRVGCFFAGCCHGASTDSAHGLWMQSPSGGWGYYVPTQLYEAIFLFVLFGILCFLYCKRSNLTHAIYLIAYGVWRFVIEFFRGDDRGGFVLGLAPSQWTSILFVVGGIAIILFYYFKKWPFVLKLENVAKVSEQKPAETEEPKVEMINADETEEKAETPSETTEKPIEKENEQATPDIEPIKTEEKPKKASATTAKKPSSATTKKPTQKSATAKKPTTKTNSKPTTAKPKTAMATKKPTKTIDKSSEK